MRPSLAFAALAGLALIASAAGGQPAGAPDTAAELAHGRQTYDRLCSACHGETGTGNGPAAPWLWPRPRDFTSGDYKWRTTPSGYAPTDDDLARAIRYGVPGTSMHSFADTLSDSDISHVAAVLKTFAAKKFRRVAPVMTKPAFIGSADVIARALSEGKAAYTRLGCNKCHGSEGKGDGPSAKELKDGHGRPARPYDLTAMPLKRPMATDADPIEGIYWSLVTGLSGTPMPAYEGSADSIELLKVAMYIDSIRFKGVDPRTWKQRVEVAPQAIAMDRIKGKRMSAGYWPGESKSPGQGDHAIWGQTLTLNGPAPRSLAPAQASLSAKQCARCHASQYRQWKTSLHGKAMSPGTIAQLWPMHAGGKNTSLESCQRCHAPLAEQLPVLRDAHFGKGEAARNYQPNPFYSAALRDEGINCASCHVRKHKRHGPGQPSGSKLIKLPDYPHEKLAIYERSDFCLGCHQLQPSNVLAGRPLLNTYREWLEGPYMRRGIQCQHCHMSNREHEWKGVHDPDTFRQGMTIEAMAVRDGATITTRARITNSGAGHFLPTTPTPAAWLITELVDGSGQFIAGTRKKQRIGRHIAYRDGRWQELEDTRIPPGESLEVASGWKGGRTSKAKRLRVRVEVAPDDYYEGMYRSRLKNRKLPARERAMFQEALRRGRAAHYTAFDQSYSLTEP